MATKSHRFLYAVACTLCSWAAAAQTPQPAATDHVEILNADRWVFDKNVATGAQRLIGHVRFRQGAALMACDSAWLYDDERVNAFGNVRLDQGDTLRITGDRLRYAGRDHLAHMEGNVHLQDPATELHTDALSYDLAAQRAEYASGARITNAREGSTLASMRGTYYAAQHVFIFSKEVRIEQMDRTITGDSLRYDTRSGVAFFLGPTWITQGNTRMYGERGSFNTRTGTGRFTRAARITDQGQVLTGDSLHYDRNTGEGSGWGNVTITDTVNQVAVSGQLGRHWQQQGRSMVTGSAELRLMMGKDTLFLHADTLFGTQNPAGTRRIMARRHVRFFKPDLQGVCDTMTYSGADSLISLYGAPFLWSKVDQISGDSVRIKLRDGKAHLLQVDGNAFMASRVDSLHFNQVAGTTMTGHFRNEELSTLITEGNSRTAYFAREKKDSTERITGLNRADCSRITVGLDSGQVSNISFITQPEAVLYPLEKAPQEELRLEGFQWNAAARPKDRADIFRRPEDH